MKFAIFILCLFFCFQAEAKPLPPVIPQEFYSTLNFSVYDEGPFPSTMYYSGFQQAYILTMLQDMGDGYINNVTQLFQKNETWYFQMGMCKPWFGTFSNLFEWLIFATYQGQIEYNGQTCDSWSLNFTGGYLSLYNIGNVPIRLYIDTEAIPNNTNSAVSTTWEFIDFQPQKIDPSVFATPESCLGNGFLCPNGTIEDMDFWFYHPTDDYSIDNNNVADVLGDAAFVCIDGFSGSFQLVSQVRVQVNTTWGSYALCNFNVCQTLNPLTVGREAAFGVSENAGQCANNSVTGSWYSFTTQSNCDNPDAESCAWKELGIVKTITADCLLQNGFEQACVADGGFPFNSAAEVFSNAFEYDDPSQGGCPSVTPNEYQLERRMIGGNLYPSKSLEVAIRQTSLGSSNAIRGMSALPFAIRLANKQNLGVRPGPNDPSA